MAGSTVKVSEVDRPVTATLLATFSGVSLRQVGVILRDAGVQRSTSGKFAIAPALLALFAYERAKVRENVDQDDSKSRLLLSKARLEELKLARELGKTITVDAVMNEIDPLLGALRAQLLTVPKKTAPVLKDGMTAGEREAIIARAINDALTELSTLPERLKDITPEVEDESPGETDE